MTDRERLASRNLGLYPLYAAAQNAHFWVPVFFLYFAERVSLAQLLTLEAAYYVAVVVLEVPSGYASDRFGRRAALLVSSVALVASYAIFFVAEGMTLLLTAQVLLAVGIAFNSGSDTSLHYDSLEASERAEEYGAREAKISRIALISRSFAALAGGFAATIELRFAYGLSLVAAVGALIVAFRFVEPPRAGRARAPLSQLAECGRRARHRPLRWLLAFSVGATVMNHVPYEFYQPYLDLLTGAESAPHVAWVAGVHASLVFGVASLAGGRAHLLSERLGVTGALTATMCLQLVLIGSMAFTLSPVVAVLLLARSVPSAVEGPILNAAVTPRLPRHLRATYLSITSLVGRLGYAILLFSLGASADGAADWDVLSGLLVTALCVSGLISALLLVSARRIDS